MLKMIFLFKTHTVVTSRNFRALKFENIYTSLGFDVYKSVRIRSPAWRVRKNETVHCRRLL